jgi:hypothetical protein
MIDVRASRVHAILAKRQAQVLRNIQAEAGGGDYINARLSRHTSESDLSWLGKDALGIASRKDRSFLINYAGRVTKKIIQYVFAQAVKREGIDPEFAADATKTGCSISQTMRDLAKDYLTSGWAWIGVDRGAPGVDPATGLPGVRSVRDKKTSGDRIFWSIWLLWSFRLFWLQWYIRI